jgi:D-tyrosyl-tRNA(Tyr) deacylase
MRAVVQRVRDCSVAVSDRIIGSIEKGLLVYLGVSDEDDNSDARYLSKKITGLRIFEDEEGKMNLSLADLPGHNILVVSQFTLIADTRKGKRPSYSHAADPEKASSLYATFLEFLHEQGFEPERGEFQAHMQVSYTNDGPVTILLDSKKLF